MIEGFVEALRPFQVRGWVRDLADPDARLLVRVQVEGRILGTAAADLFREDLLIAGIGDGRYGFVVNVSEALPLRSHSSILVEALGWDERAEPVPTFSGLVIDPFEVRFTEPSPETNITGYFTVFPSAIQGWAYDAGSPDRHLEVVVKVEGREIGGTRADMFKADLVLAGIGAGDHGFQLSAPSTELPLEAERTRAYAYSAEGLLIQLGVAVTPATRSSARGGPAFPGPFVDTEQRPVIILGAARSGTSAIGQALMASGTYAGFEEGHLLDLLMPLMKATALFYESRSEEWTAGRSTHIASIPQGFVEQGLKHVILQAVRSVFPTGKWLDKTPRGGMIAAAPLLRTIWPNARFIYMRRRAIENLDSRLRKFPGLDFAAHCQEWSLSIQNWHAVADSLAGVAVEIDQVYMAAHPSEVASVLGGFLDLSGPMIVRVAQALAFDQPERTASRFGFVTDLASLGWSRQHIETFQDICNPVMRQIGYSDDTTYFRAGGPGKGLVVW